ncbi:pyrin-like isoform X2 [Cheilinus undulatus]|nr:pyrin-like isoform X2 [Cheilinus undulatus]XP_041636345.1 pyrin-like isoform X2 [Cheilinus undulatus]XP_041636346.1 pyrin-like isoform X2 [Cheilinus undulatus]XP_041636347.1 pyrin-like isoform X2 [Cheilinus undulatus]XP_041636348.1 pyrin-like isoform X2 [Cheilinus undulatus]
MAKLKEELWNILLDLSEENFLHFKWFLNHDNIVEGCTGIPVARLEKADRQHVVDLLVQKYQGPGALTMTMKVLGKIKRNDLVERLQTSSRETKDLKNHECDALTDKYEKQKAKLGVKMKQMIKERQMKIREIKHSAELCSKSADRHIADSEQAYAMLLRTLKESLDELIKSINEKREATQKQAEKIIQGLEQEISELTKRSAEVEKLSPSKDHPNSAQSFAFLNAIPPTKNWTEVGITPTSYGGSVAITVTKLEEKLRKQREDFVNRGKLNRVQQFAKDVILDPDTAHPSLILSDDGKRVQCGDVRQNRSENSKRFLSAINVLGKQSISSGRFYYEVEVKGKTSWDLGVVKESIDKKGSINASPENGYWTIGLRNGETYQTSGIHLSVKSQPEKVGVFVDYGNHSVSFFDADTADIIHGFTDCSFSEKLYPFFSPGLSHCGENSPLVITPVNY